MLAKTSLCWLLLCGIRSRTYLSTASGKSSSEAGKDSHYNYLGTSSVMGRLYNMAVALKMYYVRDF